MSITQKEKTEVITQYSHHDKDTCSPEVQVAILTHRIRTLTEHFKAHKHDHQSRRGLLTLVGRRRSLLNYLKKKNVTRYKDLVKRLELRK